LMVSKCSKSRMIVYSIFIGLFFYCRKVVLTHRPDVSVGFKNPDRSNHLSVCEFK
jgi:hypothetical protein